MWADRESVPDDYAELVREQGRDLARLREQNVRLRETSAVARRLAARARAESVRTVSATATRATPPLAPGAESTSA